MLGHVKQGFFKTVSYLTVLFSLASCAGVGGLGTMLSAVGGSASSGSTGLGSQATDTSTIDSTGIDSSSPDSGIPDSGSPSDSGVPAAPSALPQSFIPSELVSDHTVAYSSDATASVPVIASAGAASCTGSCQVAVSASTISAVNSLYSREKVAGGRAFTFSFISEAHADTGSDICSQTGVTCCPVDPDGSFQCYAELTDQSVSEVHVAIVSSDGSVGEDDAEEVHSNLKWLAAAPTDVVTLADGTVYASTNGMAVELAENSDGDTVVQGDHTAGYKNFATSGTKLAYDSTNSYFGALNATSGVALLEDAAGVVTDTGIVSTQATATAYTVIKSTSGHLYYGIQEASTNTAYVYDAESANPSRFDSFSRYPNFQFIYPADGLAHTETLAFDINASGRGIFAYKDGDGHVRVRISDGEGIKFGGETALACSSCSSASFDIKDIQWYDVNKALLLDASNNMAWIIRVNDGAHKVASALNPSINGIAVGSNPVAMIINSAGDRAYVLNAGDETISAINLKNSTGTFRAFPKVVGSRKLSDEVVGKTLTFTPNAIKYYDGKLYVGSQGTKALLVVDVANIVESTLADERTPPPPSASSATAPSSASGAATSGGSSESSSSSSSETSSSAGSESSAATANPESSESTSVSEPSSTSESGSSSVGHDE